MIKSSFAVFAFFERFLLGWTNFVQNLISLSPPEIDHHTPASTAVQICLLIGCMWACGSACNLVDYNCGDDVQFVSVSIFIAWLYFLWPKARVLSHPPSTSFNTLHELHDVLRLRQLFHLHFACVHTLLSLSLFVLIWFMEPSWVRVLIQLSWF